MNFRWTETSISSRFFLKAKDLNRSITFKLAEQAIEVLDDQGNAMFHVTLTMNDQGECKLHANEQEARILAGTANGS